MSLSFTSGAAGATHTARAGLFVAFEGGDGGGKTTQIQRLTLALRERGVTPLVTREPGGSAIGLQIRQLLLHSQEVSPRAEALLFAADRAHHVESVILPALVAGEIVITDRYLDSSVAYQGAGRVLDPDEVLALSLWASGGLRPDLTVLLDVTPEQGQERRVEQADRVEAEPREFHARVREHFLHLAAQDPARYLVIDAGLPVDEVAARVLAAVTPLLPSPGAPDVQGAEATQGADDAAPVEGR